MVGKAGQGRKFDIDEALRAATMVFWQYGYEGATLSELTNAMGIKPPSLYKAFGSKEELFFSVIRFYNKHYGDFMSRAFEEEDGGQRLVRRLLREAAKYYPASKFPGGCLVISAAVAVDKENAHIANRLADMRNANIVALTEYEGITMPMARFVGATLQGMSQQARDGLGYEELLEIAEFAISAIDMSITHGSLGKEAS